MAGRLVNQWIKNHLCSSHWKRQIAQESLLLVNNHIFCIRQILEKKWEYIEEVHQLFLDFKKTYDSVGRKVL